MSSPATHNSGLRHRMRERLRLRLRSRSRSQGRSNNENIGPTPRTELESSALAANSSGSGSQPATSSAGSLALRLAVDAPRESTTARSAAAQTEIEKSTPRTVPDASGLEQHSFVGHLTLGVDIDAGIVYSDLWSAAYREAVNLLGNDINVAILKGENVAELFRQLDEIDKEATQDSVFARGVKHLRSLQVPLERFKLALDLAAPLANIEPTAATVVGVVRSVTAIAISISTVDLDFAKQIGEMLKQIAYIDDCDTLGQKTNQTDIYKALVSVYGKLLEFYIAAFEILTKKGAKLVLAMILENGRLPKIVSDFLKHADNLQKLIQKATLKIAADIKEMLYDREITQWLDDGKISRQSQHHASLRDLRADQACELLLADAKFISWYDAPDSQQLAILGEMGYGKTVAMAFLVDELIRRSERQLPQPKICYHYCRDGETGQAISIFSTLILSLLKLLSGLKKTFFEWYKRTVASGIFDPAKNFKKLEEFLHQTVETLDRPLFIVIDGLDECDRASRNMLLKSLNSLARKTQRLKIIVSSRPEEEILERLYETAKIYLNSNVERDSIIAKKAVERQLYYLSKDVRALVSEELSRLARGSAIWTKMVVELIEIRGIKAFGPMQTFLENIPQPGQLSELYVSLFSRYTSNDLENQKLAAAALEILAIARRPLSVLELAWAAALGVAPEGVTTVAALARLVDYQRLLGMIQPFISRVDFSDVKKRQVRLVHDSAKAFIIGGWTTNRLDRQSLPIATAIDQSLIPKRTASLEAGLLDICVRYLLLDDIGRTKLFSEEQFFFEELPQETDLLGERNQLNDYDRYCTWEVWEEDMIHYDPTDRGFGELFVYAASHWPDHFGAITAEPLPDLGNIENLCQAGSLRLHNWTAQNCRPGCAIKARFPFDSTLYDPLGITSLHGSESMLRHMLETSDFDNGNFLPYSAVRAADHILQWGDPSRLGILFAGKNVGHQLCNLDFFRLVIKQWSDSDRVSRNWEVVFDLVDGVSDVLVKERWGNELLCLAAGKGCLPVIRRLMDGAQHNAELRTELLSGAQREPHQSIGEAVLGDHVDAVEYLLGQQGIEAHLRHRDSCGQNVLHLASRICNPAMFRLLVPRFREGIHQKDHQQESVLVRIISSSCASRHRYESAEILLLEGGANNDTSYSRDEKQRSLQIATQLGDLEMCSLLRRIGKMDPLSPQTRHDDGQILLKDDASEKEQDATLVC